jgi:transcriptional regulator with XRE-family HTH domain
MSQRVVVVSPDEIGRAIARRRAELALTRAEAGELAAISPAYVAKIEQGRTSSVMEHAFRLIRRLGGTIVITFHDPS